MFEKVPTKQKAGYKVPEEMPNASPEKREKPKEKPDKLGKDVKPNKKKLECKGKKEYKKRHSGWEYIKS